MYIPIILNAWPFIFMFSGSKVGINRIASTNPQRYCDEKVLMIVIEVVNHKQYSIYQYNKLYMLPLVICTFIDDLCCWGNASLLMCPKIPNIMLIDA